MLDGGGSSPTHVWGLIWVAWMTEVTGASLHVKKAGWGLSPGGIVQPASQDLFTSPSSQRGQVLGSPFCLYFILLTKADHTAKARFKGESIDSTSWWEEQQSIQGLKKLVVILKMRQSL